MSDVTLKDLSTILRLDAAELRDMVGSALEHMTRIDGDYSHQDKPEGPDIMARGNEVVNDLLGAKDSLSALRSLLVELTARIDRAGSESMQGVSVR